MKWRLLYTLLLSLCLLPIAAQTQGTEQANSSLSDETVGAPALTVEVQTPRLATWPDLLRANGRLAAWQEAVIASEISGQRIDRVLADVGSAVKKGDVLVELSRATIENDIRRQEAAVLSAEAALDGAAADADRARSLSKRGIISQREITQLLVAERRAQADLAAAKAILASSQLDLERTEIVAADDGVISHRSATLGSVVSAGQELFRLIRQNRVEWQAELPLREVIWIDENTEVFIPSPWGDMLGNVRLIAPTASSQNRRIKVHVTLSVPDSAPELRPGILVSGFFNLGDRDALSVPATAIVENDGFSYAYVLSENDHVSRRKVTTGRRQGDRVEVIEGLEPGMQVVQAGGALLSDGVLVMVARDTIAATAADERVAW